MKEKKDKVLNWIAPLWHKDFGNAKLELDLLKQGALFFLQINPNLIFVLDCFEEGYIRVEISEGNQYLGELQIVDVNKQKIGFFTENDEFYFSLN